MKKTESTLLWPFYVSALSSGAVSVALPVWIIFFQKEFTFLQISIALSVQCLAGILCEVPTGAVADVLGRKFSVTVGIALQGLLWLTLPLLHEGFSLYGAFFLMGAFRTLESGADRAWMVDRLKDNHRHDLIPAMFVKIQSLRAAGRVIGCLASSLLLFFLNLKFLFVLQGFGYLAESILLLFFAKEKHLVRRRSVRVLLRQAVRKTRDGAAFMINRKRLFLFVLATTFVACSRDFGCIAWQPALVQLSLPPHYLGLLFSVAGVVGIVAPLCGRYFARVTGSEYLFLSGATVLEAGLMLVLCCIDGGSLLPVALLYLSVCFIVDLQSPVVSPLFHSLVPSRIRATVASAQSMIGALASCAATAVGGYLMDVFGATNALGLVSLCLIPGSILFAVSTSRFSLSSVLSCRVPRLSPPDLFILPLCVPLGFLMAQRRRRFCF